MDKKRKIILTIIIILLFLIAFAIWYIVSNRTEKEYTSVDDFETIEETLKYYNCEYIRRATTGNSISIYLNLAHSPYEDGTSYKPFYNQLIGAVANVLEYKNFKLIDIKRKIVVAVTCDEDIESITEYTINDSKTYFEDIESANAIDDYEKESSVSSDINSNILRSCIQNNWNYNSVNFGTQESTFLDYNIFFDEGMEVREIGGKIFNLVFTNRYSEPVINNIKTGDSFESIEKILGNPNYGSNNEMLIGYNTDNFYIFFNDSSEISIFRKEQFDTTEFAKIVETFIKEKNSQNLISSLTNLWGDYDEYSEDENGTKSLRYTLKGIVVKFNVDNKHGITLYNNFSGNITSDITFEQVINKEKELPQYVYVENNNMVYKKEMERSVGIVYDDVVDSGSEEFVSLPNEFSDDGMFNMLILSKNGNNPSSEIKEFVTSRVWLDNTNLAYGVAGSGIYIYNAATRNTKTLITGNSNYNLSSYENGVLKYDNTSIKVEL